jgi:glycosyltransferase involved in cell wall biosynthesis
MADRDWIAYLGPFRFPEGEAGSRRVLGMARSLAAGGWRVVVGSGESDPSREVELCAEGAGSVAYVGLGELPPAEMPRAIRPVRHLFALGRRAVRWLEARPSPPSAVILYGGYSPFVLRLHRWCRLHRVPLIADVVEWYDARQMPGGILGPFHLNAELAMRVLFPRVDGIIAISAFLERYYQGRGCTVTRVPPTLDVREIQAVTCIDRVRPLRLAYAGTPGRKDLLANAILGVLAVDPHGEHVRLLVAGPTLREVRTLMGGVPLPGGVQVAGRLPRQEALRVVGQAHFTLLLRPPARFAQAGFPTKLAESAALATPIICNPTSDLGDHVRDGIEGLLCRDHTPGAFAESLRRALSLTPIQLRAMREAARARAEQAFDYRQYVARLQVFLGEVHPRGSPRLTREDPERVQEEAAMLPPRRPASD